MPVSPKPALLFPNVSGVGSTDQEVQRVLSLWSEEGGVGPGDALVVYPEGRDAVDAVAAVDVIHNNIDETRWLDDRIPQREQDMILERLERSLWAAFDAEQGEDDEDDEGEPKPKSPSPIQELTDLLERRSKNLGAQPATSAELGRADGFRNIAEALRELLLDLGHALTATSANRSGEPTATSAAGRRRRSGWSHASTPCRRRDSRRSDRRRCRSCRRG